MIIIKIDDEIGYWGISASDIIRQLDEATGDIEIHISSPGGVIFEGVSIFNAIKAYNKGHVTTIITSLAASMASVIALAGDTVKAYDNSVYMIHNALMWVGGNAKYLRKKADHLDSLSNLMANIYIAKTGKSEKEIKALLDEETYFYGNEMLEAGFIDEMIPTTIDNDSSSLKALAIESVKSCANHTREKAKDDDDTLIAALLKDENSGVNRAEVEALAKNQNLKQGNVMTEKELQALRDSHAEALTSATADAQTLERERVGAILALSGDDKIKQDSIKNGLSVGDTAIALNANLNTAMQTQKTDFEAAAAEVGDNQTPSNEEVELSAEQKAEKEADEALAKVKV